MLKQRVITAIVLIVLLGGVLYFSYLPAVGQGFAALLSLIAIYELFHNGKTEKTKVWCWVLGLLSAGFTGWFCFFRPACYPWILSGVLIGFMLIGVWNMLTLGKFEIRRPLFLFVISLCFPVLYSCIPALRLEGNGVGGLALIFWACFLTDTGAYFIGRRFGKRKLAPVISPHKTVEGYIGGVGINIVGFTLLALILRLCFAEPVAIWEFSLLGLVTGVLDQFADLSLSAIKRHMGIKDFGRLMPGHGGVLDRFDSLLYVGPCVYIFVMVVNKLYG